MAGWQRNDTPCPSLPPAGHSLLLSSSPSSILSSLAEIYEGVEEVGQKGEKEKRIGLAN